MTGHGHTMIDHEQTYADVPLGSSNALLLEG